MLNIDFLLLLKLKVLVVFRCETLALVAFVLNQGIYDLLDKIL